MEQIKAYKPQTNSISSGQVLQSPYPFEKGRLIVREMTDLLVLDLVEKRLMTDQMVLTIGYDIENLTDEKIRKAYKGEITTDHYGRQVPKHAHGTANLPRLTSSTRLIMNAVMDLYDAIVDPHLLVRRITVVANHVVPETEGQEKATYEQMELFRDYAAEEKQRRQDKEFFEKERKLQEAMISVKKKYGKNAMLKGMNLEEGAMTIERNEQIGGHKA
jgi:DNA polymerase V